MSSPAGDDPLSAPPEVEGESISGRVTDFEDMALVGVRVEVAESGGGDLDLLPVLSDGDGRFTVEGLVAGGRYDLRFSLGTVRARTLAVPVGTDQLRVKLARPQGILLEVKVPPEGPEPDLYYVVLERETSSKPKREHFARSVRPRMLLWSIRPGRYTVTVWGGPFLPVRADRIDVVAGESAPQVEVLLSARGGIVGGEVRDSDGNRCPAIVAWRRLDEPDHAPRHMTSHPTDEQGDFVIRGLPEGRYLVAACCEDNGLAQAEVDVLEGRSCPVTLRCTEPGTKPPEL